MDNFNIINAAGINFGRATTLEQAKNMLARKQREGHTGLYIADKSGNPVQLVGTFTSNVLGGANVRLRR
jgi:hypothetical protein